MFENIKPKYWKWVEARLFGIKYPSKFAHFGYGGFTLKEWQELDDSPLISSKFYIKNRRRSGIYFYYFLDPVRKISREAAQIVLDRIESEQLFLTAPLKYCSKDELRRIALRNCLQHVEGWGAYWQPDYKFFRDTYLPLRSCLHGHIYRIHARNFQYGVFDQRVNGFIGIREKFGHKYLFTEYHWDTEEIYGTVKPLYLVNKIESFSKLPAHIDVYDGDENIELFDYLNQFTSENVSMEDYL